MSDSDIFSFMAFQWASRGWGHYLAVLILSEYHAAIKCMMPLSGKNPWPDYHSIAFKKIVFNITIPHIGNNDTDTAIDSTVIRYSV